MVDETGVRASVSSTSRFPNSVLAFPSVQIITFKINRESESGMHCLESWTVIDYHKEVLKHFHAVNIYIAQLTIWFIPLLVGKKKQFESSWRDLLHIFHLALTLCFLPAFILLTYPNSHQCCDISFKQVTCKIHMTCKLDKKFDLLAKLTFEPGCLEAIAIASRAAGPRAVAPLADSLSNKSAIGRSIHIMQ